MAQQRADDAGVLLRGSVLALCSISYRLPRLRRHLKELSESAVDDGQFSRMRANHDRLLGRPVQREAHRLVERAATKQECVARFELAGGVAQRLPRFGLGAVV